MDRREYARRLVKDFQIVSQLGRLSGISIEVEDFFPQVQQLDLGAVSIVATPGLIERETDHLCPVS